MSKASEWARLQQLHQCPAFVSKGRTMAYVMDDGLLSTTGGYLDAEEALAYADWLVATFGEGR